MCGARYELLGYTSLKAGLLFMALLFEICFYIGALLTVVAIVWLLATLLRGQFGKLKLPLVLLLIGGALILGPAIVSRSMTVDLGPRERMVSNERHVSLTGWDSKSYDLLRTKPDTVVLQMGNADVNDETVKLLAGMQQLRELDLNDSVVSDAGLAELAKLPSLRTLRLRATKITDAGFREHLMNLPALKQIDLRDTAVSTESVEEWKNADATRKAFQ